MENFSITSVALRTMPLKGLAARHEVRERDATEVLCLRRASQAMRSLLGSDALYSVTPLHVDY